MQQLHQKIEAHKQSISQNKQALAHSYASAKKHLTSTHTLMLASMGGALIGLLFFPKKLKLIKSVLRAYTVTNTLKGMLDLIPSVKLSKKQLRTQDEAE